MRSTVRISTLAGVLAILGLLAGASSAKAQGFGVYIGAGPYAYPATYPYATPYPYPATYPFPYPGVAVGFPVVGGYRGYAGPGPRYYPYGAMQRGFREGAIYERTGIAPRHPMSPAEARGFVAGDRRAAFGPGYRHR